MGLKAKRLCKTCFSKTKSSVVVVVKECERGFSHNLSVFRDQVILLFKMMSMLQEVIVFFLLCVRLAELDELCELCEFN